MSDRSMRVRTVRIGAICQARITSRDPPGNDWIQGRMMDPAHVDYGILRSWFQHCQQHHSPSNRPDSSSGMPLKVIDCTTRQVISYQPGWYYLALSYVWGEKTTSSKDAVQDVGDMPPVVLDAMEVTKNLGLSYLWVDRYCINQCDREENHSQLRSMSLIYKHAFVTIIAAAGLDANYGLPGVSRPRRNTQRRANYEGRSLVSILPDLDQVTRFSKWYIRAWTYQEGFFSTIRLVFTDEQVHFHCVCMTCVESIDIPLDDTATSGALFGNFSSGLSYEEHIESYSQRSLTYGSDALDAILGIFHVIEDHINHKGGIAFNLWGIPVNAGRNNPQDQNEPIAAFAKGLCWYHSSDRCFSTRRPEFPSWTWPSREPSSGRSGGSICMLRLGVDSNSKCPISSVEAEFRDGSMNSLADLFSKFNGSPDVSVLTHRLRVDADVCHVRFKITSADDRIGTSLSALLPYGNDIYSGMDHAFDNECYSERNRDFKETCLRDGLLGIVLSHDVENPILLLIVCAVGAYERVGLIYDQGYNRSGPHWLAYRFCDGRYILERVPDGAEHETRTISTTRQKIIIQ